MTSKAKSKGNAGERIICEFLKKVFGGHFQRVPNSGAAIGGSNAIKMQQMHADQIQMFKGDIICPPNMKYLVIESKFYQDFQFHRFLQNTKIPLLEGWLKQTVEAKQEKDFSILVMRFNRKGNYIAFEKQYVPLFKLENFAYYNSNHGAYVITDFETFVTNNKDMILLLSEQGNAILQQSVPLPAQPPTLLLDQRSDLNHYSVS